VIMVLELMGTDKRIAGRPHIYNVDVLLKIVFICWYMFNNSETNRVSCVVVWDLGTYVDAMRISTAFHGLYLWVCGDDFCEPTVLLISTHSHVQSIYTGWSIGYFSLIQARTVFVFYKSIMSNATLFIAGSIHQGHEHFIDISRERQCCFMSFSALLRVHVLSRFRSVASSSILHYSQIIDRRRQHVHCTLEYFWKTQYPRYRDAVADLSA